METLNDEPQPLFLGTRIRGLRKARGLTLTELAYPSIPALFNIAHSLGVTIQCFFASEAAPAPADEGYVVRKNNRQSIRYEDGIVDQLLTALPNHQLEMLHACFPPGTYSTYSQQSYSHEGEEAGYVLSGTFELWVGERHLRLAEGDSFS